MEHHLAERGATLCLLCHEGWPCWGYARALEAALTRMLGGYTILAEAHWGYDRAHELLDTLGDVAHARAVLQRGDPDA